MTEDQNHIAAVRYNRQVIAHIGLVGAYAVPFLLSDGSGRVVILFSYMAIINAGILVIAFRKYRKPLYYSSFLLTWLIFITWFIPKYEDAGYFGLAWTFISIFFATFYFIFLAYKLLRKEKFQIDDILLLLANSLVYYGLGYALLYHHAMVSRSCSAFLDWQNQTSILFVVSFAFINILNNRKRFTGPLVQQKALMQAFNFIMPGMLLIISFLYIKYKKVIFEDKDE
jgi:uncharacterized membrane protein